MSIKPDLSAALGALLLRLYQAAHEQPIDRFRAEALAAIGRYLPFDGAHWSLMAGREIYGTCLTGLPEHSADWFNRADGRHAAARESQARPGQALRFTPEDLADTPDGLALAQAIGARYLMLTTGDSGPSRLWHLLALVRRGTVPFSADEQALLQLLTPHLAVLLRLNEFAALARVHTEADRLSMAVADLRGVLHAVEPRFEAWLVLEWPGWTGPRLPTPLGAAVVAGAPAYAGRCLTATLQREGDRCRITLSERSPADRLTPRERAVAEAYAQGQSHKEVARSLGLSPVTVRGYLRQAYEKLEVGDKAQLARRLGPGLGA